MILEHFPYVAVVLMSLDRVDVADHTLHTDAPDSHSSDHRRYSKMKNGWQHSNISLPDTGELRYRKLHSVHC